MIRKSKFDPNSDRAIKGLTFQRKVQECLSLRFGKSRDTREWLLSQDPCLSCIQLNTLEHTWGDIIIQDNRLSVPIFIECVSINHERSIFPEHKIKKFNGENKFYCFGWDDVEFRFVHSKTWNSYAKKLPQSNDYRKFGRSNIINLKKQFENISAFCENMLNTQNACNTANSLL